MRLLRASCDYDGPMSEAYSFEELFAQLPELLQGLTGVLAHTFDVEVLEQHQYSYAAGSTTITFHRGRVVNPVTELLKAREELSRESLAAGKYAMTLAIRAQLHSSGLLPNFPGRIDTQWTWPVEDGAWTLAADKCVNAVARDIGLTERQPLFGVVDYGNDLPGHPNAVRALIRDVALGTGMDRGVILARMLQAGRGDAMMHTLADIIIESTGISASSLVLDEIVRPSLIKALTLPFEPLDRVVGAPDASAGLGATAGELVGARAAADALGAARAFAAISLTQLEEPTTTFRTPKLRAAALKERFVGLVQGVTPRRITTPEELFAATPDIMAELFGTTAHISDIDASGELEKVYPHFRGDYRADARGGGRIRLNMAQVLEPLRQFFSHGGTDTDLVDDITAALLVANREVATKIAFETLFHEGIHSLGTKNATQFYATWLANFSGARVIREGVTQLTAEAFLPDFLAAADVGTEAHDLLSKPGNPPYVGESSAMALLIATAASRSHTTPRELLAKTAAAGDGREAVRVISEAFVRGAHPELRTDRPAPLPLMMAVGHALEAAMDGLENELPTASTEGQRAEAGMDAAGRAIRAVDRAMATLQSATVIRPRHAPAAAVAPPPSAPARVPAPETVRRERPAPPAAHTL